MPNDVLIADNPGRLRYEVHVGGELAGYAAYSRHADTITILHTEIEPAFEHHGLAGQLARFALADIRQRGLRVIPTCPFFAKYIREHPEYDDLVIGSAP
jgi:predicted GNAT family acetyltransferase